MAVDWENFKRQSDMYGKAINEAITGVTGQAQRQATAQYTGERVPKNVAEARQRAVEKAGARIFADTALERQKTQAGYRIDWLLREDMQEAQLNNLRKELEARRRMAEAQMNASGWASLGQAIGTAASIIALL